MQKVLSVDWFREEIRVQEKGSPVSFIRKASSDELRNIRNGQMDIMGSDR
jgi:hypothetical protein